MIWNDEDVKLVEKFIDIRNKGFYCDGAQLTEVYNRVLQKHVNVTNCGSCLRQRVNELADALAKFKRQIELEKKDEAPVEENKKPKAKKI